MNKLYKLGLALLMALPVAAPVGSTAHAATIANVCALTGVNFTYTQTDNGLGGGITIVNVNGKYTETGTATCLGVPSLTTPPCCTASGQISGLPRACLAGLLSPSVFGAGVEIGLRVILIAGTGATTPDGVEVDVVGVATGACELLGTDTGGPVIAGVSVFTP